MTDDVFWSVLRRRSVAAAAALGVVANLLCVVLTIHRDALTTGDVSHGLYAGVWLAGLFGIPLLTPSLTLFIFRRSAPVVALLTTLLLLILKMNADGLIRYLTTGAFAIVHKFDLPGIALLFLSMFCLAMILVRAIIRLVDRLQGIDPDMSARR